MDCYFADFETSVFEGQPYTEVWAGAIVKEDSEEPILFRSMAQFFALLASLRGENKVYFHNLKFDGSFIIDYMERNGFKKGLTRVDDTVRFEKRKELKKYEYSTYISRKGVWYDITIRFPKTTVVIKDSLKYLPFSVRELGESFQTKHRKTIIEYTGYRSPQTPITKQEEDYIKNDVLVVKEASHFFRSQGHERDTIGGCALSFFRKQIGFFDYNRMFPNIYNDEIDPSIYGESNVGQYVLNSYVGAFVYVVPEKCKKKLTNGVTLDVTSLYPSVMHSKHGVDYPVGHAKMGRGEWKQKPNKFAYQRIRCRFKLKEGYLPFIKIRWSYLYNPRECLKSSVVETPYGDIDDPVVLTLSYNELQLVKEHYDLYDLEYLDYAEFNTRPQIFDAYIDYWIDMKNSAPTKAHRTIAKLFLNSLYGKFAATYNDSFKIPLIHPEKDVLSFVEQESYTAEPGYIPIGSAIISEARIFEIRAAQANYHGKNRGFCYADTDSLHIDLPLSKIKGVTIAKNTLLTFKHESSWDYALFNHAKRYIEHVVEENGEPCKPHHLITCAGLPERGKMLLRQSLGDELNGRELELLGRLSEQEEKFRNIRRDVTDFRKGLEIPGDLKHKRMKGGIVLEEGFFTIKE